MSTTTSGSPSRSAEELRAQLVERLCQDGTFVMSEPLIQAFSTVPRHVFAENESLERAYEIDLSVFANSNAQGVTTSVLSAARMQAVMLAQLQVEPGERVLEIGSGGYNAALLAEIAGVGGSITTVDIDPVVVDLARTRLKFAGYDQVDVLLADGEHALPDRGPFGKIMVTVAAWGIPSTWIDQLKPGGRIVVPLRFGGLHRVIAFDKRADGSLASDSYGLGYFVDMQGQGASTERFIDITDGVTLRVQSNVPVQDSALDIPALEKALRSKPYVVWSGTKWNWPDEIDLYLVTHTPIAQMPFLHATQEVVDQELLPASVLRGTPVLIDGGSFAFRHPRQNPDIEDGYETGVIAHGPAAQELAERYAALLRDRQFRHPRRGDATFRYLPSSLPAAASVAPGTWHTRLRQGTLTVSWP